MRGASVVFFAYIGFDAVSTAAQEAKNPQRDMPIGILGSLAICTLIYIAMSAVMTGIMPYNLLGTPRPVATALETYPNLLWLKSIVEIGAIAGLTSVILVMTLGQPRIFYSMSRDGLIPPMFGRIHPKYRTPHVGTVIVGVTAVILAGLLPIGVLGELVSMGTLLAFATVCIGVLILRRTRPDLPRAFRVPAAPVVCILGAAACLYLFFPAFMANWHVMTVWIADRLRDLLRLQPHATASSTSSGVSFGTCARGGNVAGASFPHPSRRALGRPATRRLAGGTTSARSAERTLARSGTRPARRARRCRSPVTRMPAGRVPERAHKVPASERGIPGRPSARGMRLRNSVRILRSGLALAGGLPAGVPGRAGRRASSSCAAGC